MKISSENFVYFLWINFVSQIKIDETSQFFPKKTRLSWKSSSVHVENSVWKPVKILKKIYKFKKLKKFRYVPKKYKKKLNFSAKKKFNYNVPLYTYISVLTTFYIFLVVSEITSLQTPEMVNSNFYPNHVFRKMFLENFECIFINYAEPFSTKIEIFFRLRSEKYGEVEVFQKPLLSWNWSTGHVQYFLNNPDANHFRDSQSLLWKTEIE